MYNITVRFRWTSFQFQAKDYCQFYLESDVLFVMCFLLI